MAVFVASVDWMALLVPEDVKHTGSIYASFVHFGSFVHFSESIPLLMFQVGSMFPVKLFAFSILWQFFWYFCMQIFKLDLFFLGTRNLS